MDQKKIGAFLKQLRKEKGLTQEQLAARFGLSSRSVSRWETGRSLPDIGLLTELADFYAVDVRSLLEGQHVSRQTPQRETLQRVAEYAARERSGWLRFALGLCMGLLLCLLLFRSPEPGLLWGLLPDSLCRSVTATAWILAAAAVAALAKSYGFQPKPSREPVRSGEAEVVSKAVKPGTGGAGRSKGGYSYTVLFRLADGTERELYAYEAEFGSLQPGMEGILTHQGPYFLDFQPNRSS